MDINMDSPQMAQKEVTTDSEMTDTRPIISLEDTTSQQLTATEQLTDTTADIEMNIQQDNVAAEQHSDGAADINTIVSEHNDSTELRIQLTAEDGMIASQDKSLNEREPDRHSDLEMVDSQSDTRIEQGSIEVGMNEPKGYDNVENKVNRTTSMAAQDHDMTEKLRDTEGLSPNTYQASTVIKQEHITDDSISVKKEPCFLTDPMYPAVKEQKENCGHSFSDQIVPDTHTSSLGDYGTRELPPFQGIGELRLLASNVYDHDVETQEKSTSCDQSHKRKQPHEGQNRQWCDNMKSPQRVQESNSSEHSKLDSKAIYRIPKRQKTTATDQQAQGRKQQLMQAKNTETNGRGDSARQLNLQANVAGETTTFLNLLRGSNPVDVLQGETTQEKAPKVKAAGWNQQFRNMLANCPKTSDMKINRSQLAALEASVKNFGRKVKGVDGVWMLNGMTSGLLNHQVIGVDWMIGREESSDESKGGILADSMGLGKTVQTLATMVSNRAKDKPKEQREPLDQRSTLIIAGPSLLAQWASEIDKHTSDRAFRGVTIFDSKKDFRRITDNDIVLASYGEVSKSCPFPPKEVEAQLKGVNRDSGKDFEAAENDSAAVESWIQANMSGSGILHKVEWYRIVIDEAHKMKNHESRISYAVNALKGKHKWALSGTPIMNSYEELYPYFRFFREPDAKSLKMFRAKFCNVEKKPENMERLDKVLARLLLSRTMQDKFMGRPLVDLPGTHSKDPKLEFFPHEKILYEAMEGKFIKELNETLKDQIEGNDNGENCDQKEDRDVSDEPVGEDKPETEDDETQKQDEKLKDMLIGITRLRQMTAHPLLVERDIQEIFDIPELEEIYQKLLDLNDPKNLICRRIGILLEQKKCGHTEYGEDQPAGDICRKCWDIAHDIRIIPLCKHRFCKGCIEVHAETHVAKGNTDPECPQCGTTFGIATLKTPAQLKAKKKTTLRTSKSDKKSDSKGNKSMDKKSEKKSTKKPKIKGLDSLGNLPIHLPMPWLADFDSDISTMPPSTKLSGLENQIKEWMTTAPSDKIIIFTQWRTFTAIVGRVLERHNIGFVYFTGDMSMKSRQDATLEFRSNPSIKLMVATLKTAGEGLNLEFANRVVSTDLWWNVCAERQAFCRVYRIGQTKETHFTRLIVANSVDDRILEMQTEKLDIVDQAMKPKLSRLEMAKLFGRARKDKKGCIQVQAAGDKKVEEDDFNDSDSEQPANDLDTRMDDSDSDETYKD